MHGQYLLYRHFEWDTKNEYCVYDIEEWKEKILNMKNDSEAGNILEVDLEYITSLFLLALLLCILSFGRGLSFQRWVILTEAANLNNKINIYINLSIICNKTGD